MPTEILYNGGAEIDANWANWGTPTTNVRSTEQVHGGTYSRKVVGNESADGVTCLNSGAVFPPTTIGLDYIFSGWIYVSSSTASHIRPNVMRTDTWAEVAHAEIYTTGSWVYFEIEFTAATSTTALACVQAGTGATTFYCDDWSLQEAAGTTSPPTSPAPTTAAPTTVAPTTIYPSTLAPTTVAPTTVAPTTEEPTTLAPTTAEPTTLAPTTLAPTTTAPTTLAPTTLAPTTIAPTTLAPTTEAPTSLAPTTLAPTTVAPTTTVPTTLAPTTTLTTSPPTTVGPTTEPPCIWNDDMTGADGFMPDSGYWEVVQESPQVVSNALRVDMPSGPAAVTDIAQSTFWLGDGDFDIVIDFLNFSISNLGGAQRIRIQDPTNTYWAYLQRGQNASGQFIQGRTYNTIDSTYNVSPASGQFRFTRVGNAVRCYADYGSGMTQIRADLSFNYTGPMKIVFSGWHYSNNPAVTIDWDNFVVNVGCDAINETTAPPTTLAPTTVAPTTEPPTSVVGTTALPSSLPPTTSPPTTVVPSTLPVSTTPPTTVAVPTTLAPTTLVPTTEPPFICTHPEYSLVTDEGTLYSLITDEGTLISIIC